MRTCLYCVKLWFEVCVGYFIFVSFCFMATENTISLEYVRRMSHNQIYKLTKDQLTAALKDAINVTRNISTDSPRSNLRAKPITKEDLENALDIKLS